MGVDLFIDLNQYRRISEAQSTANDAKITATKFDQRLNNLERRSDRLALACQALWELLKERTQLSEQDVFAMMERIDLRDGKKDGKIGGRISQCNSCGKTINATNPLCVYCGHRNSTDMIVQ